jgi:hypothetical protein
MCWAFHAVTDCLAQKGGQAVEPADTADKGSFQFSSPDLNDVLLNLPDETIATTNHINKKTPWS